MTSAGPREPTDRERQSIAEAEARQAERPERVAASATMGDAAVAYGANHADAAGWTVAFQDAFGSSSDDFTTAMLKQLEPILRARGANVATAEAINFALALLGAIAPANELEAAMGVQMIGAHLLAVDCMVRARSADVNRRDALVIQATKLTRAFALHAGTLAQLRLPSIAATA